MSRITISEAEWPLIIVRINGLTTEAQFRAYLEHLTALLVRGKACAVVVDVRYAGPSPTWHRELQIEWIGRTSTILAKYCVGMAFVTQTPAFRFVLSTMFLVHGMPMPYTIVDNLTDAKIWAKNRLPKDRVERERVSGL